MEKKEMTFDRFCKLTKRYVLLPIAKDSLHDMYVDFKKTIRYYDTSATEFILNMYSDSTLDKHSNCLKRNKNRKSYKSYIE